MFPCHLQNKSEKGKQCPGIIRKKVLMLESPPRPLKTAVLHVRFTVVYEPGRPSLCCLGPVEVWNWGLRLVASGKNMEGDSQLRVKGELNQEAQVMEGQVGGGPEASFKDLKGVHHACILILHLVG